MKKYLPVVLIALAVTSALSGGAERNNLSRQTSVSDSNFPFRTSKQEDMPDKSFCNEEYQKLLALQFDNYEDMTISDYRNRVWDLIDNREYLDLLERFSQSETLYDLKDTDETAAFLFYVLEPFTAKNWESKNYSGYTTSCFPCPSDNAVLEYVFTLTVLDADTLTIREYTAARLDVINGMQNILSSKSKEALRNADSMTVAIGADTDNLIAQLQTEKLGITIEYSYLPLTAPDDNSGNMYFEDTEEQRRYANGTKEDYRSLLALKTPDYQNLTIADFNNALLAWANENHERMERISEDTVWNDFQVNLTAEELSFVKLTVFLSGMENGKAVQSIYTGTKADDPCHGEELPQKTVNKNGMAAWCSLYYRFSYNISNSKAVTVGERDRQIEKMINDVHAFWNNTDIEDMLKLREIDIVEELEKIAAEHSSSNVTITINEKQVHFERMDEIPSGYPSMR